MKSQNNPTGIFSLSIRAILAFVWNSSSFHLTSSIILLQRWENQVTRKVLDKYKHPVAQWLKAGFEPKYLKLPPKSFLSSLARQLKCSTSRCQLQLHLQRPSSKLAQQQLCVPSACTLTDSERLTRLEHLIGASYFWLVFTAPIEQTLASTPGNTGSEQG